MLKIETVKNNSNTKRDMQEKAANYLALAILLPKEKLHEYLIKENYSTLSKRKKLKLINKISREYQVEKVLVIKQIKELELLYKDLKREDKC